MPATIAKLGPLPEMHTSGIFSDMTVDGPEIGTLVVIVDRAKNLPNRKTMGKQDPYCAARLGKDAKKTGTDKRGGQTPKWDQELRFTVHDSVDYYNMKVSVFNDDKKTELIGETLVNLTDVIVPGGGQGDSWQGLNCRGKYAGEIRIELTYYDTRPKPEKPAVEAKRETTYNSPDVLSGRANGPREITPVKRRPLPNNPLGASPNSLPGSNRSLPQSHSGPRPYMTPPRQSGRSAESTPSHHRHTFHPGSDGRRPLPDFGENNHSLQEQMYHEPADMYASQYQNVAGVADGSPMDDYDTGFSNSAPAVPRYAANRMSMPPRQETAPPPSQGRMRPFSTIMLPHSNSEPVIPHYLEGSRDLVQNANGDDYYTGMPHPRMVDHRQLNGYPPGYGPTPHGPPRSAMQPTVEDEDDGPPPPPPVHRSSAPDVVHYHDAPPSYEADMAPAPLRLTSSREGFRQSTYGVPQEHFNEGPSIQQPLERRSTYPIPTEGHARPVSRDAMVSSPLRNEVPTSLVAGYHPGEDPSPARQDSRMRSQSQIIPQGHEMIMHSRQMSQPDFQISPNYTTPPRPHPLAQQELASPPTSSQYYQDTTPGAIAPVVKPRAFAPSPNDNRMSRGPVRGTIARKSVSPRPTSSQGNDGEQALSKTAFSPDDFSALNPSMSRPEPASQSSYTTDLSGSIIGFDGRKIDPSDHLPTDSWAPEPEPKGPQKDRPFRERDRLTGARELRHRERSNQDIRTAVMGTSSPLESSPAPLTPPGSGGRNRLQKRPRGSTQETSTPPTHLAGHVLRERDIPNVPAPAFSHSSPNAYGQRNSHYNYNTSQYSSQPPRHGAGGAPVIPPKIPLSSGGTRDNMDRLSEEMSRIDIGPGGGRRGFKRIGAPRY